MSYQPRDCVVCGRRRVLLSGVCEKCGYDHAPDNVKMIDGLLIDLKDAANIGVEDLERYSSVTARAMSWLREEYEAGATVTLAFANHFDATAPAAAG